MGHSSYEDSIKKVYFGLVLLAVVTLIEVFISLFGKGYIVAGVEESSLVMYVVGFLLIAFSVYKAYFIIFEFMHMKYEAKGLALTVLLPMGLLVWGIIAFFQEGGAWGERRELIKEKDQQTSEKSIKPIGMIYNPDDTKYIN